MNIRELFMDKPHFNTTKMKLSERIINLEMEKGYSQQEAAKHAKVSLEIFVQMELGREDISLKQYMSTIVLLESVDKIYDLEDEGNLITKNQSKLTTLETKKPKKMPHYKKFNRTVGMYL